MMRLFYLGLLTLLVVNFVNAGETVNEIAEKEITRARLTQEERQQRAAQYLRLGEDYLRSRQYQAAVENFALALGLQPDLAQARMGRDEALRYLEVRTGVDGNLATQAVAQAQVRTDYNRTEIMQYTAQAQQVYQEAITPLPETTNERRAGLLNQKLQLLDKAENFAERANLRLQGITNDEQISAAKVEVVTLKAEIKRYRLNYLAQLEQIRRETAQASVTAERQMLGEIENNRRSAMFAQAQRYFDKMEYNAAIEVINELLKINPADSEARSMLLKIREARIVQRDTRVKDLQRENRAVMLQNLERATIADVSFGNLMRYPRDWDILVKRKTVAQKEEVVNEAVQETRRKLEGAYSFDFIDAPLIEVVLENIRSRTGLNINTAQIPEGKREMEINFMPRAMRLDNIFKHILRQINNAENAIDPENLEYEINSAGVINFTTYEQVNAGKATDDRVFDVRDIFAAMESAGRMPSGFEEGDFFEEDEGADEKIDFREVICRALPQDFPMDGENIEFSTEFKKLTVRRSTPEQIQKVADLISRLRTEQMIQVSVVARFLQLQDSFWEQFRSEFYDFNNYANSQNSDNNARNVGGMSLIGGAANSTPNFVQGGNGQYNSPYDSIGNASGNNNFNPGNHWGELMGSSFNGTFTGLSSVFGSGINPGEVNNAGLMFGLQQKGYLGDLQTQWFLQMVRQNTRKDILFAPHIVVYNNCYGWIRFGDIIPMITGYTIPTGLNNNDTYALKPMITMRNSGNSLQIAPVVSSDKKYITVCVEPKITRIIRFSNSSFGPTPYKRVERLNPATGESYVPPQFELVIDGEAALSYTLDMPQFLMFEAKTYASVPDGGAVLMGGLATNTNARGRSGTPILQDLPIIGNIFSSRYYQKEKENYTCLVSAKMIIFDEEEARQSGGGK